MTPPNTPDMVGKMSPELERLLVEAKAQVEAMSPEEYAAMVEAQRASWARAFSPCEHGIIDFEECPHCNGAIFA